MKQASLNQCSKSEHRSSYVQENNPRRKIWQRQLKVEYEPFLSILINRYRVLIRPLNEQCAYRNNLNLVTAVTSKCLRAPEVRLASIVLANSKISHYDPSILSIFRMYMSLFLRIFC